MSYDFDKQINRTDTSSLKWDHYSDNSIIPPWVADMDFRSSDEIIHALHERVDTASWDTLSPPMNYTRCLLKPFKKSINGK